MTKPLVAKFSSEQIGFQRVMMFYGAAAVLFYLICFWGTREQITAVSDEQLSLRDSLKLVLKNRPLILLSISIVCEIIVGTMAISSVVFYAKYNLAIPGIFPKLMVVLVLCKIVAAALSGKIANRFGKKKTYIGGMLVYVVGALAFFFTPTSNLPLVFITFSIMAFASTIPNTLAWAMEADTVEFGEWKTGARGTGVIYSVFSFMRKLGQAFGGMLSGLILSGVEYVPNVEQTELALSGIKAMVSLIPAIGAILATVVIFFYPLTEEKCANIVNELKASNKKNNAF